LALLATALLGGTPARATFPGPNGRIAFADYVSGQIYAVDPDGSGLDQLTHTGPKHAADDPSWSRDGKRLLFEVFRTNRGAADRSRIWIMRADGTHEHLLAHEAKGFRDYEPSYTPDAGHIVFSRCKPFFGVCGIWAMRADGTHKSALTPYVEGRNAHVDFDPSVAPNGKRIAFTRFFANGIASQVDVMRSDGNHGHPVTPARLEGASPDWSPSGRRVTFSSNSQRTGSSVFTMRPSGTGLRRITPSIYPHNDLQSVYAPRGNRLVFVGDHNYPDICCNDLFAVRPNGGGEQIIATGLSDAGIVDPAWGSAPIVP
jgi:Tol biopolymer transport system component